MSPMLGLERSHGIYSMECLAPFAQDLLLHSSVTLLLHTHVTILCVLFVRCMPRPGLVVQKCEFHRRFRVHVQLFDLSVS
jgi:hypothetical protein